MDRRRSTVVLGRTIVRPAAAVTGVATVVALAAGLAGCGPDGSAERPFQPTLPSVDARPKLVLVVADGALTARPGTREDPAVRTDPPTVPSGSVVAVRNGGSRDHRLRGGDSFDTGIMRPGEETVVVLANPGPDAQALELVEVIEDRRVGQLTVTPAPADDP